MYSFRNESDLVDNWGHNWMGTKSFVLLLADLHVHNFNSFTCGGAAAGARFLLHKQHTQPKIRIK